MKRDIEIQRKIEEHWSQIGYDIFEARRQFPTHRLPPPRGPILEVDHLELPQPAGEFDEMTGEEVREIVLDHFAGTMGWTEWKRVRSEYEAAAKAVFPDGSIHCN